jgi:heme/copper-type cytochrome/quinol oxidase subunit 3
MSMRARYLDVSGLPAHAFGSRDIMWWAMVGFIVIEGSMFAMLLATWAYLHDVEATWPPAGFAPPALRWGTLNTIILLGSVWPNHRLRRAAETPDLGAARRWMLVMDVFGLAFLVVRGLELATLNVRWDSNAYGSIIWTTMGFHTLHLLTDAVESLVLTAMLFIAPGPRKLTDAADECVYWDFVVLVWLPLYAVIYLAPRWS